MSRRGLREEFHPDLGLEERAVQEGSDERFGL